MTIFNSIHWFGNFLKDKIIEATFFFTKPDELKSYKNRKEYSENFLNDFAHQERIENIWRSLLNEQLAINNKEICEIYRVNFTQLLDWSVSKIKYYIENRFWSSLDLFEVDTWNWRNKDVFDNASLINYIIVKKDKSNLIVLTSLHNQKYTLLKTYHIQKLPLWKFKRRQMVYSTEKGFLSI